MKRSILLALTALLLVCFLILVESSGFAGAEITGIHLYQRFGSPVMGYFAICRFTPTCSHYALQVLQEEGFWKANLLTVERLMYCSPIGALFLPSPDHSF